MIKRLRIKARRIMNNIKQFFKDPPLDVIGGGVIANLAGRTALYGAFGITYATMGMPIHAALFVVVMLFDVVVHVEVLSALRRLMVHEVEKELSSHQLVLVQPIG